MVINALFSVIAFSMALKKSKKNNPITIETPIAMVRRPTVPEQVSVPVSVLVSASLSTPVSAPDPELDYSNNMPLPPPYPPPPSYEDSMPMGNNSLGNVLPSAPPDTSI